MLQTVSLELTHNECSRRVSGESDIVCDHFWENVKTDEFKQRNTTERWNVTSHYVLIGSEAENTDPCDMN